MPSNKNDLFGGFFDFNGDGKTTIDEEYLAYKIFEETTKESTNDTDYEIKSKDDFIPTYHSITNAKGLTTSEQPERSSQHKTIVPEPLTKDSYLKHKSALKSSIVTSILTGLFLSFVPIVVMWATIASYDGDNSAYWLIFLLFFGGGLVALGIIWSALIKSISQDSNDLHDLKKEYLKNLSEDELSAIHRKKRTGWILTACIIGAIIAGLITISLVNSAKLSSEFILTFSTLKRLRAYGLHLDDFLNMFENIREI